MKLISCVRQIKYLIYVYPATGSEVYEYMRLSLSDYRYRFELYCKS